MEGPAVCSDRQLNPPKTQPPPWLSFRAKPRNRTSSTGNQPPTKTTTPLAVIPSEAEESHFLHRQPTPKKQPTLPNLSSAKPRNSLFQINLSYPIANPKMTRTHHLCALLCLTLSPALAQSPDYQPLAIDSGAAALHQSLRKLNTRASLMMIVAHPDDEDGGMLAYESRGLGAHVSLLTLNRGEGGQNIMSNDLWDQLALVRTQELLSAGRYYGVDQSFTRVADFGFSKTLEEAMTVWNHDRVLYDVVRAVRRDRPLVLAASFVGGITDGHGQHQVSGEITQEVFTAAGDPNVFPEQIKAGLLPWKPLKVYARVPGFSISPKGMYDYATGKWSPYASTTTWQKCGPTPRPPPTSTFQKAHGIQCWAARTSS